jgi:hypothetical protein
MHLVGYLYEEVFRNYWLHFLKLCWRCGSKCCQVLKRCIFYEFKIQRARQLSRSREVVPICLHFAYPPKMNSDQCSSCYLCRVFGVTKHNFNHCTWITCVWWCSFSSLGICERAKFSLLESRNFFWNTRIFSSIRQGKSAEWWNIFHGHRTSHRWERKKRNVNSQHLSFTDMLENFLAPEMCRLCMRNLWFQQECCLIPYS